MQWVRQRVLWPLRRSALSLHVATRRPASTSSTVQEVPCLNSWDLEEFRGRAFNPAKPYRLPYMVDELPLAVHNWFIHDSKDKFDLGKQRPQLSELRTAFWSSYEETLVPLELTSRQSQSSEDATRTSFHRAQAPLKLLLTYLGNPLSPNSSSLQPEHSIYLAQCSLNSLPWLLHSDVPTPSIVAKADKGDVYDSSLWLGRPPTYTPLHRDPNPNFFFQLAGKKVVRLFPSEVGESIFEHIQERLQEDCNGQLHSQSSSAFRGEEMMAGPERDLLHKAVWEDDSEIANVVKMYGQEAEVGMGEALFIPKGWWHSVKGVGEGIVASVNWWFR